MKRFLGIGTLILVIIGIAWGGGYFAPEPRKTFSASLEAEAINPAGFARADGSHEWDFPTDFGPHPDYQTEWWYYTGNLQSADGRRFGYQLTFFRRGLTPPQEMEKRDSRWGTNQIYMGHFALSDIAAQEHTDFERFSRGAAGLAGTQSQPFQVWLENWEVIQSGEAEYQLRAEQEGVRLTLTLTDLKGPIFHGKEGYSQKGPEPGNASYYFSQTRLETKGIVQVDGEKVQVTGWSWMDHEFSTSALSPGQVGWDWFSIQLEDGTDLMVFQIRQVNGSIDPFSSGTMITLEGETTHLNRDQFEIQVRDTWRSPHSGAEYPASWTVIIPSIDLVLQIQPYLADQEMNLSYSYWEGAVSVRGTHQGQAVSGSGYVELTGYATSMEGEF